MASCYLLPLTSAKARKVGDFGEFSGSPVADKTINSRGFSPRELLSQALHMDDYSPTELGTCALKVGVLLPKVGGLGVQTFCAPIPSRVPAPR